VLITDIDTPAILVDRRVAEANLKKAQDYADRHGIALRPHIKTHKLPLFAHRQIALGAVGITCQKLGEAEVMADAGLMDIHVSYNILGRQKLERLKALHRRVTISVTADSSEVVSGYADAFADSAQPLTVLVECDTGADRCGVQSPADALALARHIEAETGLAFGGLMTYPPRDRREEVDRWLGETVALLNGAGIACPRVSNGGTPDFYSVSEVASATEHRPGTYIYSDRMQVAFGHGTLEDCALTVLATVVSRPTDNRAILDSGSKALAADLCPAPGHGHIVEYPEAVITGLNEEHGMVDISECNRKPAIGEKVRIIPNHVCVVSNLFDTVNLIEDGEVIAHLPVAARGKVT
jgi:D-serine deaminase-like pyridoxal phosphate-dependent protein